ncbi:MAG: N-acetylmuramoyl-L-alanine amidase [Chloroflexi bacterium]|nr:N-acetylmuramoyl-L-alanine amidase [Chloroflexota bacterium]
MALAAAAACWLLVGALPAGAAPGDAMVDVALDPGHSQADIGAVGNGLAEHLLTFDLAQRVQARLQEAHLSVRLTRHDDLPLTALVNALDDDQINAEQTARIQAGMPARIFVSLHFNGGPPALHGTETYYNPERAADPTADEALASALQNQVVNALDASGYPDLDRGVKSDLSAGKPYGHFFSLRGPVPSALVESLFLSNSADASALHDSTTLDAIATGVAQGVLEYLAGAPASG